MTVLLGWRRYFPTPGMKIIPKRRWVIVLGRQRFDLAFLDGDGRSLRGIKDARPWRLYWHWRARHILILRAGSFQ
jgi:hypothetical protein